MTVLADMHAQLARGTCEMLHNVMHVAVRATGLALKHNRNLTEPEQRTLLDGFRAAAMSMDIARHEERRERFGLSCFFPPKLVVNLVQAGQMLAQNTALLEKRRDRFVLEFQLRLRKRLEKRLQPKDSSAIPAEDHAADAKDTGEQQPKFTADPSPDHGYKALAILNGNYDAIQVALQKAADEVAEEEAALHVEVADETEEAAGEPQAVTYNRYYTPERAARFSAEFKAARTLGERQEVVERQAREMYMDFLMNPPDRNQTGPPE